MKLYFEKRVVVGFIIALAIIAWLGIRSFLNNQKFVETSKWVSHTNEVLFHSEQILTTVIEMETSQRGYILTNDDLFLEQVAKASDTINDHLNVLGTLIKDNAEQQEKLEKLRTVVQNKTVFVKNVMKTKRDGYEMALDSMRTWKGVRLMDSVKMTVEAMQEKEKQLLQERIQANEKKRRESDLAFVQLLAATVLILIFVFGAIHVNLKARSKAEADLMLASSEIQDLYENAPCGYHSVDKDGFFVEMNTTLLSWLGYRKDQIIGKFKLNDIVAAASQKTVIDNFPILKKKGFVKNLEFEFVRRDGTTFPVILNAAAIVDTQGNYVKSRSTVFDISERKRAENKIAQLNKEMDSFTYSVSHDLRAPLRSIDGYAKILEEDYAPNVDAEGKRVIDVIMNNARRMGNLIDGLLDFSRIGKRDLMLSTCNMYNLAMSVIQELTQNGETTSGLITVQPDMATCPADLVMMRQVWTNLISNAIKFSSQEKQPVITVGSYTEKHQQVYYVKDNGVGFDMQYAHKLFGVFQRLHKVNDFEGTGVGLAIVHRIITKHDGAIWAEAKLNEGATFFFSIPNAIS